MRRAIVFLEQQSWLGGGQRVLEATIDTVAGDYDCIVAFPDSGSFRSALEQRNLETLDFPIGNYQPGRKSWLEMAVFAWRSLYCGLRLAVFIRRRRIALVYINGPRCLPAGVLAAWLTGRTAIFHLHLILTRKSELLLVRARSWRVSRILACSNAAASSLVGSNRRLHAKTQVVYNPLRQHRDRRLSWHSELTSRSPQNHFMIGVVGRITESKGHHLLLQAIARLPLEVRNKLRILFVGSEAPGCESDLQYARKLQTEASRQGLEQQIIWAGFQPDPGPCYASMDVLVHPALAEAIGIAILEALDRGIPVIAARTGGIPEVVRDGFNGLLVSMQDEDALCQALALFVKKRRLRERLQAGARCGLDRRFSMETFSSAIRTVIGQLCPLVNSPEPQAPAVRTEQW